MTKSIWKREKCLLMYEHLKGHIKTKSIAKDIIWCASKASSQLVVLGNKLSDTFLDTMKMILKLDSELVIKAHNEGKNDQSCTKKYLNCKHPKVKCDL